MNAKTLRALKASIEKWERFARGKARKADTIFVETCPLCREFWPSCSGCPVANKTGSAGCIDTPWEHVYDVFEKIPESRDFRDYRRFRLAARVEVDFLKSLLPKGKR